MIKERQIKLLSVLTPKEYNLVHNENGFFFQKKDKNIKWCITSKDAFDFLMLITKRRERHWWETDEYVNEYI